MKLGDHLLAPFPEHANSRRAVGRRSSAVGDALAFRAVVVAVAERVLLLFALVGRRVAGADFAIRVGRARGSLRVGAEVVGVLVADLVDVVFAAILKRDDHGLVDGAPEKLDLVVVVGLGIVVSEPSSTTWAPTSTSRL